jgi:hypothetical protein
VHASSRRHLDAERAALDERIKDLEPYEDALLSLSSLVFCGTEVYGEITKATAYLSCAAVAKNVDWQNVSSEFLKETRWARLKEAEISNPEKDIIFKLWHNTGLTPKMALSMGLFNSRDCPFCNFKNISTSHYPLCSSFLPLWTFVTNIITTNTTSLSTLLFQLSDKTGNILIFYAMCSIYKAYIHILNGFSGIFNPLTHFKQTIFGRILSEYHAAQRSGQVQLHGFHRKWKKYKLYRVENDKILIEFPR